jgi:hypothetical protein
MCFRRAGSLQRPQHARARTPPSDPRAGAQDVPHTRLVLTAEGREALDKGSPEARVLAAIPAAGTTKGELRVRLLAGRRRARPAPPCAPGSLPAALRERGAGGCAQRQLGALADAGLSQAMRLRWVSVEKGAAKAPASEPAAGGGSKADKKKDKGDADRVTRQVPPARPCDGPRLPPRMPGLLGPHRRRALPALPRMLRRPGPTAGPRGGRRQRFWTSRSSSCARSRRARRARARRPPAGPGRCEGAGARERAAAGVAAGAGLGDGGRAQETQAAGGGGVEDVPAGPRAQVRAGAPPRGRGPHARDGGQARARRRRRLCAGPVPAVAPPRPAPGARAGARGGIQTSRRTTLRRSACRPPRARCTRCSRCAARRPRQARARPPTPHAVHGALHGARRWARPALVRPARAGTGADTKSVHQHGLPGDAQQRVCGEQARPSATAVLHMQARPDRPRRRSWAQQRAAKPTHGLSPCSRRAARARAASGTLTRSSSRSSTRRATRTTPSS